MIAGKDTATVASVTGDLIDRYFDVTGEELLVDGVRVSRIVAEHGTPLFIYSGTVLDSKLCRLRSVLPPEFSICYSVKANPNPLLFGRFLAKSCGLEIASGGEFYLALNAGCPPERILFAGPGKSVSELEFVLSRRIGEIHVESLLEVDRIGNLCRRLGQKVGIAVRVNPPAAAQGGAMRMGGKAAPFGIDLEQLDAVLDRILRDEAIEFRGLHFYVGTQILDCAVVSRQYREAVNIAEAIALRWRRPMATVNFGGGLGVPYFSDEREFDLERFGRELDLLMTDIRAKPVFAGTKFVIEPGRYLTAEAGIYAVQVNDIKLSRGKKFLIVDGGMNHHLAASGNLGQVIKRNFPIAILNKMGVEPQEKVDVVGPLCTPLDVLARDVDLPAAEVGDIIGVFQSGAYARTASPAGISESSQSG